MTKKKQKVEGEISMEVRYCDGSLTDGCGQSIGTFYSMSRGLRDSLRAMSRFIEKKGINVAHMHKELVAERYLTTSQATNLWTHGVRLGVVAHVEDETGNYLITNRGFAFLNGEPIPKYAMATKRTRVKGTRTIETSVEKCVASDFNKKNEYWEVPGFEIREGRVITGQSAML